METIKDLFGNTLKILSNGKVQKGNPMVTAWGSDKENRKCKNCKHLYYKSFSKRYYKCELRGDTNGPGTDHKVNFPACQKYED